MQSVAEDCEWGVCPSLFHSFWLVRRGQWRAGSSQRQRDGSGWSCALRELEAQQTTKGRQSWAVKRDGGKGGTGEFGEEM